jgi:chaperonin GroEL
MNSYKKAKSAAKIIIHDPKELKEKTLSTLKVISDVVGSTLGPSGRPVLIERQEYGLPNILTKDGVTVFRSLGFEDPVSHAIMESARDASTKTVAKAGDGTTTATVLSYAFVKNLMNLCESDKRITPQKVTRELEKIFKEQLEPEILKCSKTKITEQDAYSVAKVSANGDTDLADAVMKCFDIVGNDGAIVVTERSGRSEYAVEHIEGYSVETGYEESCKKFLNLFINDRANNRVSLEDPVFVLYSMPLTDLGSVQLLMEKIGTAWERPQEVGLSKPFSHNVVVVAPDFSESVLSVFGTNTATPEALNVVPMICPRTGIQNSEQHFLEDLAAVTGAKIFDPITAPLNNGELSDLGYGIKKIEMGRFKTVIHGLCEPEIVKYRAEQLKQALSEAASSYDAHFLEDRIARLNGGIAKLVVVGSSSGELREKKDRAEDAIAAVRGAIKQGCLPGGGNILAHLSKMGSGTVFEAVVKPSLLYPIQKLLENCGLNAQEVEEKIKEIVENSGPNGKSFDGFTQTFVDPYVSGLLDSTPAVLEALRNSISISAVLGTVGGVVVFERDSALERQEAVDSAHYMKSTGLENA